MLKFIGQEVTHSTPLSYMVMEGEILLFGGEHSTWEHFYDHPYMKEYRNKHIFLVSTADAMLEKLAVLCHQMNDTSNQIYIYTPYTEVLNYVKKKKISAQCYVNLWDDFLLCSSKKSAEYTFSSIGNGYALEFEVPKDIRFYFSDCGTVAADYQVAYDAIYYELQAIQIEYEAIKEGTKDQKEIRKKIHLITKEFDQMKSDMIEEGFYIESPSI